MPIRDLPARASLEHLKNEAKALHKAFQAGDAGALERIRAALGDMKTLKLTDAQRVVAREYGFPTWAQLRAHVLATGGIDDAVRAFLDAVIEGDRDRASIVLNTHPLISGASLHVAAVLGRADDVARLITEDPSRVQERVGRFGADPLLYLAYSPFHGESQERDAGLTSAARTLLQAGADPNTRDAVYRVPALFAVTAQRTVLPIARLLLDAGANPTDGESLHHSAERFREDALQLLLDAGADLNACGDWGNAPLYFLLRWHDVQRNATVRRGVEWLLDHGADPNIECGSERETALHLAARIGQHPEIVQLLLAHGADVHARRGDGRTAWMLAARGGFDETAALLESHGAQRDALTPVEQLLAACGRGDAGAARSLSSRALIATMQEEDVRLLPHAAAARREATVIACIAAGFPIDTVDDIGATALHHSAISGRSTTVRALLDAGASVAIIDRQHNATPLGWACWGADFLREERGDYAACIRALIDAGAQFMGDEHRSQRADLQAILALAR